MNNLLIFLFVLPLTFSLFFFFIPRFQIHLIKNLSLFYSIFLFFYSLILLTRFDILNAGFQFKVIFTLFFGFNAVFGIDGISLFFILLTTFLMPIVILVNWESVKYRIKDFTILLFFLEFLLISMFISLDLLFFYIFFEGVLIPMFLIIGIWGSRSRKLHAAYQFFFYTFFGSILMLVAFITIYLHTGSTNLEVVLSTSFSAARQIFLWLCFFFAFAIKVPIMPFHIWLPEAHVEAPTAGSILLAGILLKLGTYGFLRFLIPLFPYANMLFKPMVFSMCLVGILLGSLATIRQIDLKKIIAYSSIVHMNFAIIGLFTGTLEGIQGSFFLMISHGVISSALFFSIGVLYDRYHTRIVYYYGGLVQVMPLFSILFLVFILSNMGFPCTSGFIGEILILFAMFSLNYKVAMLMSLSMVFSSVYSLWLYNRVVFGELKNFYFIRNKFIMYKVWFFKFSDLTKREFFIFFTLLLVNLILGIYPSIILNISYLTVLKLL